MICYSTQNNRFFDEHIYNYIRILPASGFISEETVEREVGQKMSIFNLIVYEKKGKYRKGKSIDFL